jgi:hypothetical protein
VKKVRSIKKLQYQGKESGIRARQWLIKMVGYSRALIEPHMIQLHSINLSLKLGREWFFIIMISS